jgi:predicted esterase
MSLHCLYSLPELVDAAIGISGYLFPFTHFDGALKNPVHVIYGLADDLRPW